MTGPSNYLKRIDLLMIRNLSFKGVPDRSAIMVCEIKSGAKILPAYSPLDIKVKQQLQSGENASLYVNE